VFILRELRAAFAEVLILHALRNEVRGPQTKVEGRESEASSPGLKRTDGRGAEADGIARAKGGKKDGHPG